MTVAKSLPHLWQKVRKLLIPKLFLSYSCIFAKKDKIVAVYTNLSEKGVRLNEIHKEWVSEISSITTYTTTNNKNLQEVHVTADQQVIVPSESVTTVIYNLK